MTHSNLTYLAPLMAVFLAGCVSQPQGQMTIGPAMLNVARTALEGGSPQMAINVTSAILKSNPQDVEALIDRGDAYYEMADCREALLDYHRALMYSKSAAGAQIGIGRCLMTRNPQEAVSAFAQATKDNPRDAVAFNDLGVAEDEAGNIQNADAAFKQALMIKPSMKAAEVNLGFSLAIGGQPARAQRILAPLAETPDASVKIREDYAAALAISGKTAQARNILQTNMTPGQADTMIAQFQSMASSIDASHAEASMAAGSDTVGSTQGTSKKKN